MTNVSRSTFVCFMGFAILSIFSINQSYASDEIQFSKANVIQEQLKT